MKPTIAASNFFFPFFDWIRDVLFWWKGVLETILNTLMGFFNTVYETFVNQLYIAFDGVLEYTGDFFENFSEFLYNLLILPGQLLTQVLEWMQAQFLFLITDAMEFVDGLLPEAVAVDTQGLYVASFYARQVGFFVDIEYIFIIVLATFVVNGAFALAKIIWRSIPTVG